MSLSVGQYNPIRVTGTTSTAAAVTTNREATYVKRIVWFCPAVVGDLLVLKDKHGTYIAEFRCEVSNQTQVLDIEQHFDDIYCDDMDSGTLYIYTR